jgi:hypothetical protein
MSYNQNVLTNNSKVSQVESIYYLPSSLVQGYPIASVYAFIGQEDPFPSINGVETPTVPTEDQQYLKKVFKNMISAKLLGTNNISPVIQRINWTQNTVYIPYSDTVNMFQKNSDGTLVYQFYVKNKYDQVFKCLWNNNGGPSLYEPYFQPGTYGTNNIFANAGDGYKWKYMYTIDAGSKRTFMDANWMPVPVGVNTPQPYLTNAGTGDIEVINVTNGGSGYDAVNSFIVVTVTGDGQGVVANVTSSQITNGIITDVIVEPGNSGNNYTNASVSITAYTSANLRYISPFGSGATAIAPVSPVGGHGYDPISELGCNHVMYSVEFNGSEGGVIPVSGVNYRQVGLVINPQVYGSVNGQSAPVLANGSIYNTTTQLTLSSGAGALFSPDEIAQQTDSLGNILFQGTVVSFDSTINILQLINTTGSPVIGSNILGLNSGAARTIFNVSNSPLIPFSGYIAYIENRPGIQRSADSIEQFKFVLGY